MSSLALLTLLIHSVGAQSNCLPPFAVGTRSHSYMDSARMNRVVSVLLRYPAVAPGVDAPALTGCGNLFPVYSFGHGFTISNAGYDYFALALAGQGFVVVLPGTESGLSPSHDRFATDLNFAARAVQQDVFFAGSAGTYRVYGGHSMGGGAAFLAAARDRDARALFVMAPAQTNPSAIAAAAQVRANSFIELGSRDCVTPRASNGQAMFDVLNLPSNQKTLEEIPGGSHCQFATGSITCAIGEQSCGGSATLSESLQQGETRADLIEFLQSLNLAGDALFLDDFE
jgi:dienelactone hydrolase